MKCARAYKLLIKKAAPFEGCGTMEGVTGSNLFCVRWCWCFSLRHSYVSCGASFYAYFLVVKLYKLKGFPVYGWTP